MTLYDLTNTFFEGEAADQPKAARGHSKEEALGLPALLTLGLALDGSGFVRRSQVFPGAVNEDTTPAPMLDALGAPADALAVMDAGVATAANIAWLRESGYRYLAVSRERTRRFDPDLAVALETRSRQTVHVHKEVDARSGEARLYCYSEARAKKERGIAERFAARFEDELRKLDDGLKRPRTRKSLDHVWQRIGRIREKSRGAGAHYVVDVRADDSGEKARAVTWKRRPRAGTMISHPGVYCLRTNLDDWDEETLWRTYTTLTDVEAVFRSLKSELGMRPIFHRTQKRSDGHLFITVIAYQLVQTIRRAPARDRRARKLGHPARYPPGPAARHRHLPPQGRPDPSCAKAHPPRAPPAGHLSGTRRRPSPRRHQENDRLSDKPPRIARM